MPILTPISSAAVTGRYASQSDIEDRFGISNVAAWSQLDGTSGGAGPLADSSRIQRALSHADADIDAFFRDGPYTVPLTVSSDRAILTNWAATLAGIWLYQSRGLRDDTPEGNKYSKMLADIGEEMRLYKSGVKRLAATRRWPGATGPSAI